MPKAIAKRFAKSVGYKKDTGGAFESCHITGGCVPRAISIATGRPYRDVYKGLYNTARKYKSRNNPAIAAHIRRDPSPRAGVDPFVFDRYMKKEFGLRPVDLEPEGGKYVADFPKKGTFIITTGSRDGMSHTLTLKDGVVYDKFDSRVDEFGHSQAAESYFDISRIKRNRK